MKALLLAWLCLSTAGCFLGRAARNNDELAGIVPLRGTLEGGVEPGKPRWVVLYKQLDGAWVRYSQLVIQTPGAFEFLCLPGRYLLFAFEDQDEDRLFQTTEPAARSDALDGFAVGAAGVEPVTLKLGLLSAPPSFEVALAARETLTNELVQVHAGDLASLGDERFSPGAGDLGLWQGADFARKYGVGISFLAPYAPEKIPVLFVHGAGGTARDFSQIIGALDLERFQPWVVSYPSGVRLSLASLMVRQITDDLQQRLGFRRLLVVAHSMGGLVARDFVTQVVEASRPAYVTLLLTISSPFGGVSAAKTGVDRSPVVLPSWTDVATGSEFLKVLLDKPLPASVPHYLFFGFSGGEGTDGVIALDSQLHPAMQQAARQVMGFPENHTAILNSPAVITQIHRVLCAP